MHPRNVSLSCPYCGARHWVCRSRCRSVQRVEVVRMPDRFRYKSEYDVWIDEQARVVGNLIQELREQEYELQLRRNEYTRIAKERKWWEDVPNGDTE